MRNIQRALKIYKRLFLFYTTKYIFYTTGKIGISIINALLDEPHSMLNGCNGPRRDENMKIQPSLTLIRRFLNKTLCNY